MSVSESETRILVEWVRNDPRLFVELRRAFGAVVTGSVEIHFHEGTAQKIRIVHAPVPIVRGGIDSSAEV